MYNANFAIDMIQNTKKAMVNSFVQHAGLRDAMIKFIDTQTQHTKDASKAITEANAAIVAETWNAVKEFDYSGLAKQFATAKSK